MTAEETLTKEEIVACCPTCFQSRSAAHDRDAAERRIAELEGDNQRQVDQLKTLADLNGRQWKAGHDAARDATPPAVTPWRKYDEKQPPSVDASLKGIAYGWKFLNCWVIEVDIDNTARPMYDHAPDVWASAADVMPRVGVETNERRSVVDELDDDALNSALGDR